ncbi:MAG: EamA family transporter [Candidatus Obscuribacterales bacterium]|nr:EamA family transporter [Steroidobacteraceae bacterium]
MRFEYLCIALVAIFWGGYPLVARASGVGGATGALILTLSALAPIGIVTLWQGNALRFAGHELAKLVVAGVMMGIGLIAFNAVANSKQLDASVSIPIVDTAMLLVTVVGAVLFFAEPVTVKKCIGIGLLITGILVLRP